MTIQACSGRSEATLAILHEAFSSSKQRIATLQCKRDATLPRPLLAEATKESMQTC